MLFMGRLKPKYGLAHDVHQAGLLLEDGGDFQKSVVQRLDYLIKKHVDETKPLLHVIDQGPVFIRGKRRVSRAHRVLEGIGLLSCVHDQGGRGT